MYCTNCGNEIKDNVKFCTHCGKQIAVIQKQKPETEEKKVEKEKKTKSKKRIAGIFGVSALVLFLCVSFGILSYKSWCIKEAKKHMADASFEAAIDNYENAIAFGDKTPENYIMLATACVETGDLYRAREVLKEGYEETWAIELLDVSIWGPMSAFEIMISTESITTIRQKYVFDGDVVKGYQQQNGLVMLEKEYFFDSDGLLQGMEFSVYENYTYGGGDFLNLCPYTATPVNYVNIADFYYEDSTDNGAVEVYWDGEPFFRLYMQEGKCKKVEVIATGYAGIFQYDEHGRVTELYEDYGGEKGTTWSISYVSGGGYNIMYTYDRYDTYGAGGEAHYDSDGKSLSGSLYYGDETISWKTMWQYDNIRQIYYNDILVYEFLYDQNENVTSIVDVENGLETLDIQYNINDRVEYIHYMKTNTGEEIKKYLEYKEDGALASVTIEYVMEGRKVVTDYTYGEDGTLLSTTTKQGDESVRYEYVYDELGRQTSCNVVDVVYIPGTYRGVAEGFADEICVDVTVDEGSILSIEVVKHSETAGVGTKAFEYMTETIINGNSTSVDAVSGSTITSNGFINAVNHALEQAKIANHD